MEHVSLEGVIAPPGAMPLLNHLAADRLIQKKFGLSRSPDWPKVEKTFLAAHPRCVVCGQTKPLNVHHKFPFHYVVLCGRPDLELDPRNLITLCVPPNYEHHLLLGHLDDYESYNPRVLTAVKTYASQTAVKIRKAVKWQQARTAKPRHLDQMTPAEKIAFKKMLDRKFPLKPALFVKAVQARTALQN
jgi:hypothetical protein